MNDEKFKLLMNLLEDHMGGFEIKGFMIIAAGENQASYLKNSVTARDAVFHLERFKHSVIDEIDKKQEPL